MANYGLATQKPGSKPARMTPMKNGKVVKQPDHMKPHTPVGSKGTKSNPPPGTGGTPGTKPTTKSAPPVAPFLTPEQEQQRIIETGGWGDKIAALTRTLGDTVSRTGFQEFANQQAATLQTRNANDAAAGRGIFGSSIQQGDVNDIASTLMTRNTILETNLATLRGDTAGAIARANVTHGEMTNTFNQEAVANAQAVPPDTSKTTVPGTPGTGGAGAQPPNSTNSNHPTAQNPHPPGQTPNNPFGLPNMNFDPTSWVTAAAQGAHNLLTGQPKPNSKPIGSYL